MFVFGKSFGITVNVEKHFWHNENSFDFEGRTVWQCKQIGGKNKSINRLTIDLIIDTRLLNCANPGIANNGLT
jgi:hypothetical protein